MSKRAVLLLSLQLLTRVRCSDLLMSDPSCFEHGVEYHGGGLPDPMVDQVMQMNLFCQPSLRQEKGWVRRDRALKMRVVATCKSKLKPRWALQRPASSCARCVFPSAGKLYYTYIHIYCSRQGRGVSSSPGSDQQLQSNITGQQQRSEQTMRKTSFLQSVLFGENHTPLIPPGRPVG